MICKKEMLNINSTIIVPKTLKAEKILNDMMNNIISFGTGNVRFVTDFKMYNFLKNLSSESMNLKLPSSTMVLKIKLKNINCQISFSLLDSDYLIIERFIKFSGNVGIYEAAKEQEKTSTILIKLSE